MGVPKSQRMSWSEIITWSLLCWASRSHVAMVVERVCVPGHVCHGHGDLRCRSVRHRTVLPMYFLIKTDWAEREGPAKIADEIERKLKG